MRARMAALVAGLVLAFAATGAPAQTADLGDARLLTTRAFDPGINTSDSSPHPNDAMQARAYLDTGMAPHRALGYAPDPGTPDIVVPLYLDHPYVWSVYMRAGETYRAYAACDDACTDLDMEIYAADGNLADRDTTRNDTPYVQITPAQAGRVYVRIWLYACSAEPCYAAARVVEGGRAVERQ